MKTLTLIRGLPGSGKSTLAKALFYSGEHAPLSSAWNEADMFFTKNSKYEYEASKIKEAHTYCQHETMHAMNDGYKHVIVSNTFVRKWEMQPYIDAAAKFGYAVQIITCEGTWSNVHGVPEEKIAQMRARWEY